MRLIINTQGWSNAIIAVALSLSVSPQVLAVQNISSQLTSASKSTTTWLRAAYSPSPSLTLH